jgi:uncharacterized protein (DUF1697 family)
MADQQIALIRGINVGRAKRVAMAELRALIAECGFGDARTLLNSGNVIYAARGVSPDEAAAVIEQALAARLGVSARVIVLSAAELAAIIEENPLLPLASDPSRLLVGVLASEADRQRLAPLIAQDWGAEALALGAGAGQRAGRRGVYLWCPDGVIASRLAAAVSRALGDAITTRNWATMCKLYAMLTGVA